MPRTVVETVELVRPGRRLAPAQLEQFTGRPRHSREYIAWACTAKSIYNLRSSAI